MSSTLKIAGSTITLSAYNSWPIELNLRFAEGYSTLSIERRGGTLPGLPDPWLGKTVELDISGTAYFKGDITDAMPTYQNIGWVTKYLCRDLKARVDRIPMTDSNTLTDAAAYNLTPEDPRNIISRQGRTVGQIVTDVLTMQTNANNLNAKGVGAYTSLSPPTLPASTTADLAALTVIPPSSVYVQGEKLMSAVIAFLRFWAPNSMVWIQPTDGAIRVLDKRTFSNHTLTLGTDPIDPMPLRRSIGECFQRVIVRGQPIAERKLISTHDGTLAEDFAWGSFTNAQAKANWTPAQATQDVFAKSNGTCTCPSTTTVTVTSSDATQTWTSNFWDQTSTGHMGVVDLIYSGGSGLNWVISRRIVSNTALSAGGTSTLTLDLAMPATNYDHYRIYGLSNGSGLVWKKYKVVDTAMGNAMARQFTYPAPWVGANGDVAVMTSAPMGSACWSNSGNPPYQEWAVGITLDPSSAHIYFLVPTYVMVGYHVPSDVRALIAVNTGNLTATYPADIGGVPQYAGTSNTVDGQTDTLTVMVEQWRDPLNQTGMNAYVQDLHDSVKDSIVDGNVTYHGLYLTALTPGAAISVTGHGYLTGWEGLALPILGATLRWNSGVLTQYTTEMEVSNRRAHFSASAFLHPDRMVGAQTMGVGFGYGMAAGMAAAMQGTNEMLGIEQTPGYMPDIDELRGGRLTGRYADAAYNRLIAGLTDDLTPKQQRQLYNQSIAALNAGPGWETGAQKQRRQQQERMVDRELEKEEKQILAQNRQAAPKQESFEAYAARTAEPQESFEAYAARTGTGPQQESFESYAARTKQQPADLEGEGG